MNTHVLYAVFKRNFVSYFANPTGYVFICVFVFLSSMATFWPADFFNNNLANLDQLSIYFPLIMLIFIPSIAMGIWSDERRQGTDELLLTIPASDFDIVLGKFLAGLAIYTVSLLFSLCCNILVLFWLGKPDVGLFLGTYLGYWLIGMSMLSIGMVASFLTGNLTLSYIFGVLVNLPLIAAGLAGMIFGGGTDGPLDQVASFLRQISIQGQLADFSRGVVSISGIVYFAAITAAMLYLCMVLISRRHWFSGAASAPMTLHYLVRFVALAVIALGASALVGRSSAARIDVTAERLNSLSKETLTLLDKMEFKKPVQIEAFISPNVPESYVQTRLNLLSALRELEARGKGMIRLDIHDTELLSKEAGLAEKKYGIEPTRVFVKEKGIATPKKIFLNVVVSSGLQSVPPIFFDLGIPIEYELIRSVGTVTAQQRKRIGVLATDAQVMSRPNFNPMGQQSSPSWQIVAELQKQYDVVSIEPKMLVTDEKEYIKAAFDIDPGDEEKIIAKGMELLKIDAADRKKLDEKKIEACKAKVLEEAKNQVKIDALLAVQPSTLAPEDLQRFVAVVAGGMPTAIFEDPFPRLIQGVAGTSPQWPRPAPGGMQGMMMGMRGSPKGDIKQLWELLGVDIPSENIVWQNYNPYPKAMGLPQEFIIVDQGEFTAKAKGEENGGAKNDKDARDSVVSQSKAFNPTSEVTSGLQQVIFPLPGGIVKRNVADTELVPLAITGRQTGTVDLKSLGQITPMGFRPSDGPARFRPTSTEYVLAGEIIGKPEAAKKDGDKPDEKKAAEPAKKKLHVVLVGDIDWITDPLFYIRSLGRDNPQMDVKFDFDNVTFVLNILDSLTGDTRFIDIRKHRPMYRTLERIEEQTREAKQNADKVREESIAKYERDEKEMRDNFNKILDEIRNDKDADTTSQYIKLMMATANEEQKLNRKLEQNARERDKQINAVEREKEDRIAGVQATYKLSALLLPPILPLVVAFGVFLYRRGRESEGVSRKRLR